MGSLVMDDSSMSYLDGGPPPILPFESCWAYFQDTVGKTPDNVALISMHQPAELYGIASQARRYAGASGSPQRNDYLRWTFKGLETGIERLAAGLAEQGVGPGTPILTFMPNCAEQVLIYWAAQRLGAFLAPLNPRNLASRTEIEHMVRVVVNHSQGCRPVLISGSEDTARQVDQLEIHGDALKFSLGAVEGWSPFEALMLLQTDGPPQHDVSADTDSIVLFTSGTTSTPKACPRTHGTTIAYVEALKVGGDPAYTRGLGDVASVMVPNNHSFWVLIVITYQLRGATVLFPSPFFEARAFLDAREIENCTHCALVPTMLHALLAEKGERKFPRLKSVTLGGSALTPEMLEQCISDLGADKVETGYGSTEGVVMYTGSRDVPELVSDGNVASVLRALPGQHLKICDPETHKILPRGVPGQIHLAGSSLVRGYLDVSSEMFYEDSSGRRWFNIEDQGIMRQDGRVLIIGRYKDMIIRGGENIAPAAIEGLLGRELPHLAELQIQIVGGVDLHSGEVPVAVVSREVDEDTVRSIKGTVHSKMGSLYSIDDVVAIQNLGNEEYPTTMAGKVQKNKLEDLVNDYRKIEDRSSAIPGRDLGRQARKIVAEMMGIEPERLIDSTQLSEIGDSITLMRIRHRITKQVEVEISGDALARTGTFGELVRLVEKASSTKSSTQEPNLLEQDHSPGIEDLVFASHESTIFERTKRLVTNAIRPLNLDWKDVRQITPAYDFSRIASQDGTFDRWSFKLVAVTKHSKKRLRAALDQTLANNPMAASFMVWDAADLGPDLAVQLTVEHTPGFLEQIVEDAGSVSTAEALGELAMQMSDKPPPPFPGPLFRAYIYDMESTGGSGVICDCHHAIMDGSFSRIFFDDLDSSLNEGMLLKKHVPYKLWCDLFHSVKKSPAALATVKYHVERAKDIASLERHIWPSLDLPVRSGQQPTNGLLHTFPAQGVQTLCSQHKLTPAIVLKAAHALFMMRTIEHPVAIFGHVDAGRGEFPFLPRLVLKAMSLDASDVSGQLLQTVLNVVQISDTETTLAFLTRMHREQGLQTKYACAPWDEILSQLESASAALFPKAACLNQFNWLGTEHSNDKSLSNLERTEGLVNPNVAPFTNNVRMKLSPQGDVIALRLRSSVFFPDEVQKMATSIQGIVDWMTDRQNWERKVIEVVGW